jgi:flagellar hook-associated protein 1 FlgK
MSLFSSLNVALSGLQTTQTLLNTTTRNITNAQTTGYVRETQQAITNVTGGGGVLAGSVQRQVDLTLLNQQWANNAATNYNSTQSALLTQLDNLNGNPSEETSLSAQVTALGNAFQQLSSNPTDPASANAVLAAAQNLALTFNEQTSTVQNLASTATQNISTAVTNVNTDLQKIASLNQQIVNGKALGQNVGELQDELNDTVTDLSQYMTVNTFYDNQGFLNVYSSNYAPLASNYAEVLSYNGTNNTFSTSAGNVTNIGGQLGADQLTVGVNQPPSAGNTATYLTQLSDIAAQLTTGLNAISQTFVGDTTAGSKNILNANGTDFSNLYVGEAINDPNFAAGTTITAIHNAASSSQPFTGNIVNGTNTITNVTSFAQPFTGDISTGLTTISNVTGIANLYVGETINNSNFAAGTTITGINTATNTVTVSNASTATATATSINAGNLSNLYVGETLNDPNFPAGTTITGINTTTNTVTVSNNATGATATGATITAQTAAWISVSSSAAATKTQASINAQISIPLFQPNPPVLTGNPPAYSGAFQVSPTITTDDLLVGATNGTNPSTTNIIAGDQNFSQAATAAQQFLLNGNATFTAPTIAGTQTFNSALTSQTVAIGQSLTAAQTQATTLGTFGTQITQAIASGSEVNLDTELSNMVVLQNLYASNARVVQTTQKMLDDLLGLIQ